MSEEPAGFRIVGPVSSIEVIAVGGGVRISAFLRSRYGGKRWRKLKGIALIEDEHGSVGLAEIHWFEAHGIGRVQWKIKRRL